MVRVRLLEALRKLVHLPQLPCSSAVQDAEGQLASCLTVQSALHAGPGKESVQNAPKNCLHNPQLVCLLNRQSQSAAVLVPFRAAAGTSAPAAGLLSGSGPRCTAAGCSCCLTAHLVPSRGKGKPHGPQLQRHSLHIRLDQSVLAKSSHAQASTLRHAGPAAALMRAIAAACCCGVRAAGPAQVSFRCDQIVPHRASNRNACTVECYCSASSREIQTCARTTSPLRPSVRYDVRRSSSSVASSCIGSQPCSAACAKAQPICAHAVSQLRLLCDPLPLSCAPLLEGVLAAMPTRPQ